MSNLDEDLLIVRGWPLSNFGGLGLYVETIAHGLHQQGHEVNVLTSEIKAVQKPYIKIRNQLGPTLDTVSTKGNKP